MFSLDESLGFSTERILNERMKREDIVKAYPVLWGGLTDIDWEDDANIRSAIVLFTDEGCDELLKKQFEKEIEYSCYTTPDN